MASKVTTRLALLLAPLVLAGCSDSVMKTIGLQRDPPDEFKVTTQPALAMPPDLNVAAQALPRPDPGASRPQDVAVRQQAEDAMIGGAAIGGGPTTGGDTALVQAAGPAAPADIREEVDAQGQKDQRSRKLSNRLNPLGRAAAPVAEVDPAGERQRLQENAALGRSPAAGQTPLVKPGNRGPLGNLLDSIF